MGRELKGWNGLLMSWVGWGVSKYCLFYFKMVSKSIHLSSFSHLWLLPRTLASLTWNCRGSYRSFLSLLSPLVPGFQYFPYTDQSRNHITCLKSPQLFAIALRIKYEPLSLACRAFSTTLSLLQYPCINHAPHSALWLSYVSWTYGGLCPFALLLPGALPHFFE